MSDEDRRPPSPAAFGGVPVEGDLEEIGDDVISLEPEALISEFDLTETISDAEPPAPAPAPTPAAGRAAPTRPGEPSAERARAAPTDSGESPGVATSAPPAGFVYGVAALAVFVAVASLTIIVLLLGESVGVEPTARATPAPAAADSATSTRAGNACAVLTPPRRIASAIERAVPPHVAIVPGGQRVAIGFAEASTLAVGVTAELPSLDSHLEFTQPGASQVLAVVPVVRPGGPGFQVDRGDGGLTSARTVDADPPFRIGRGPSGLVRAVGDAPAQVVWPGEGDQPITLPRVATVTKLGHAVAFRRGGMTGRILSGWLKSDGSPRGELDSVAVTEQYVGTPSVAANDQGTLVVFAARPSAQQPWSVRLSRAEQGRSPAHSVSFNPPPGGPGGEAIAPSAAGLAGGRWLLQWTEGGAGRRTVRVLALAPDLAPTGAAIEVSPPGVNAGQGLPVRVGDLVLSVFLVVTADRRELWGTVLRCPSQ